ncbi:MAG: hypothetical protein IKQ15_08315 [Kiritimatiellae bacterium]|nr:hypothetical protein [Kiritimatiellia bacterium]
MTKKTNAKADKAKTPAKAKTPEPSADDIRKGLKLLEDKRAEDAKLREWEAEQEAKWRGWTLAQMFNRLWRECEELGDMMLEARGRLWERDYNHEGDRRENEAIDQTARCFVDELYAISTFARHACEWMSEPAELREMLDWQRSKEGIAALQAAQAAHPDATCFEYVKKAGGGYEVVPSKKSFSPASAKKAKTAKASKAASVSKTRSNTNTAPTSAKPSKGRRKGDASA